MLDGMESVHVSELSHILPQELVGLVGKVDVLLTIEDERCIIRICAQPFELWLRAMIEAAKRKGLVVTNESAQGRHIADCLRQMKAKHVELNSIVAKFIKKLNDIIGHKIPRTKAAEEPDTVPPYFPGPADVYSERAQNMTLPQLENVIHSICDFIQEQRWGPRDVTDLRDALVEEAWRPLASSVGTWAGINSCFEVLEAKAREAGYANLGSDGVKLADPYEGWRAECLPKIWFPKDKSSEKGSNEVVVPPREELREEEGGSRAEQEAEERGGTKRARGAARVKAIRSGGAGRRSGRQRGGQKPATAQRAKATPSELPPPDAVTDSGGVGPHIPVASGGNPMGLQPTPSDNLNARLAGLPLDLDPSLFPGLSSDLDDAFLASLPSGTLTDSGPGSTDLFSTDGFWTYDENGKLQWVSSPGSGAQSPLGTGSTASTWVHGDAGNGGPVSPGELSACAAGGEHFPILTPDPGRMDVEGWASAQAATGGGVGRGGNGASSSQHESLPVAVPWSQGVPTGPLQDLYAPPHLANSQAGAPWSPASAHPPVTSFPPGYPPTSGTDTRFSSNTGLGAPLPQAQGVAAHAPGRPPPPPATLHPGASHHGAPYATAPNPVRSQVHPSQATHYLPGHQGGFPQGDLYPPPIAPPGGGFFAHSYHTPEPGAPAQHTVPQSWPSAGPGYDGRHLHAPGNGLPEAAVHFPGHSNASPGAPVHTSLGSSPFLGGQQPGGWGGQPAAVPQGKRSAEPMLTPKPPKQGNVISRLFNRGSKRGTQIPGAVSHRGVLQGGPAFHAPQPPQMYYSHSGTPGSAQLHSERHVDPRAFHPDQFRRPLPVMATLIENPKLEHPADEAKPGAPLEPVPRTRGIPPGRGRGADAAAGAEWGALERKMQVLSVSCVAPVYTKPPKAAGGGVKPGVRAVLTGPDDGKAYGKTAEIFTDAGSLAMARGAAKAGPSDAADAPGAADGLDGEASATGASVGADAADSATKTEDSDGDDESGEESDGEDEYDEESDGADSNEGSDDADSDVTADASGDVLDGQEESLDTTGKAEQTVAGAVIIGTSPSVLAAPDAANRPNAHSYAHGERPTVVRRQAPEAAQGFGADNLVTVAAPVPGRNSHVCCPAVGDPLPSYTGAKPNPGAPYPSPGDRNAKLPLGRPYQPQMMGVPAVTNGIGGLPAAAAAGLPANGSVNGTTATGLKPWARVPGGHPVQWGATLGGAPKRVFAEPAGERALAHGGTFRGERTESPSSVLSRPLAAERFTNSSNQGSKW